MNTFFNRLSNFKSYDEYSTYCAKKTDKTIFLNGYKKSGFTIVSERYLFLINNYLENGDSDEADKIFKCLEKINFYEANHDTFYAKEINQLYKKHIGLEDAISGDEDTKTLETKTIFSKSQTSYQKLLYEIYNKNEENAISCLKDPNFNLRDIDLEDTSPLYLASQMGCEKVIDYLISDNGYRSLLINQEFGLLKHTALLAAIHSGNQESLLNFLEQEL